VVFGTTFSSMQPEAASSTSTEPVLDPFRKILVPIVPSQDDARYAFLAALELQRRFGSELRLVTFTEFGENEEWSRGVGADEDVVDLEHSAQDRLRRFVEHVAPEAVETVTYDAFEDNDVPRAVDRAVTKWGATMVVLTTHSQPGIFRARHERIMQAVDVPVLLLRTPPPEPEPEPEP
jgi:nucleotide-binding universal stress UspA family protein